MPRFGGIEAGGSKFVCGVGNEPADLKCATFPTTTPQETIAQAVDFFRVHRPFDAIGIASFGPLDLNPKSGTFGHITSTPKVAWRNFNFAGAVQDALQIPVGFDTDVNAAALAESRWGAAQGLRTFLYVTVGTGIGGGAIVNGQLLHGRSHPEMGHIRVPRDPMLDPFPGNCPYHGDCLEGLIAAPALHARWGQSSRLLSAGHPAWELFVHYLALGLTNWICTLSPEKVVLGGGIMQRGELFPRLRSKVIDLIQGYIEPPDLVPAQLGDRAGVLGAIALAQAVRDRPGELHV
jgi:fructokinase